ncbi:uncharacterized protein LOC132795125 [Drosophila nasuta]|uniref:uncharacterized protein LOC132795125 n=1 Tax=Drosophila nasuta TaxID=42062 RepID=UPI00295EDA8A|nr:uncharacterized protein LOC132795125 [Drosophila nasuta]
MISDNDDLNDDEDGDVDDDVAEDIDDDEQSALPSLDSVSEKPESLPDANEPETSIPDLLMDQNMLQMLAAAEFADRGCRCVTLSYCRGNWSRRSPRLSSMNNTVTIRR